MRRPTTDLISTAYLSLSRHLTTASTPDNSNHTLCPIRQSALTARRAIMHDRAGLAHRSGSGAAPAATRSKRGIWLPMGGAGGCPTLVFSSYMRIRTASRACWNNPARTWRCPCPCRGSDHTTCHTSARMHRQPSLEKGGVHTLRDPHDAGQLAAHGCCSSARPPPPPPPTSSSSTMAILPTS